MTTQTVRPVVFMVAEPEATETVFQELKRKLEALGPVANLVLDSSLCGDLLTLLQDAIGISQLPLAQPQIQVADHQITILGQATLWQLPQTPVTLQLGDSEEGLTFSLMAGDLAGNPAMNLTALATQLLPAAAALPELTLAQLVMSATPQAKRLAVDVTIQDSWPIPLGVTALTVGELHMKFEYAPNAVPWLQAEMSRTTTIDQIAATVTVAIGEQLALTCTIPQINFTALAQTLLTGLALPDDLPALSFADVELQVQPQTGDFAFQAASDAAWDLGLGGFAIEQTSLRVSRTAGAIQGNLTVTSAGPVVISDDTQLAGLDLTFDFQQGQSWSAAGKLAATLFDHTFALEAEVSQEEGRTFTFAWQATDPIKLVDTEMATLAVDALTFTLTRQAATEETPPVSQQTWKLTSHGQVNLPHVLENAQGSLEIEQNAERTGLAFVTEEGHISVALPLAAGDPTQTVTFTAAPKRITIGREQLPDVPTKQTVFEAETELAITGLYPTLAAILPTSTPVTFRADANGIRLSVEKVVEGITLPLPMLNLAEAEATLGAATLAIRNLKLALGRTVTLSADMALDLPAAVNQLFGADTTTQIFNQHLACTIGADPQSGLFFKVLTPIFQVGEVEEDGHVRLDFGDFGAVRYAPLMVSYDGANFAASGEFEQVRPLKLPLTFMQKLLKANQGTKFLADMLPNSLPLKNISALQRQPDGTLGLDANALNRVLQEIGQESGMDLPTSLFDLLAEIAQRFNRLPADFRNYLEIVIPDFFKFAVAVTPGAGFGLRLDIQTRENDALRFLYPVLLPVPTLVGVTLRKLAIGEIFSGSLLLTEIDAVIDQFDLPTLATILALPVDQTALLPNTTQVGRKFTVRNLFMPIFYQAGIPIPLPLFYDDLGFEYLGLEGLGLGMKWQFPKPQMGITDLLPLFKEMAPFFTEADTQLDPAVFDKHNLGLHFGIAPGFAQLPKYLGGKVLGSQDQLWDVAMGEAFARMLNAIKHPALAKIIPVAPFTKRVGVETINLGGMNFDAAWAITTGEEFKSQLMNPPANAALPFVQQLQTLPAADQAALLNLAQMSATPQGGEQDGAVILLLGEWAVKDLAAFNVQVGLAQSPQFGFGGSASFRGQIGNLMSLQANGSFVLDQGRAKLRGANSLRMADQTIFTGQGDIELAPEYLRMAGSMNLFPASSIMHMSGNGALQINQTGDFTFAGAATLLGFTQAIDLSLTQDGFRFATTAKLFDLFQANLDAQCPLRNLTTADFLIAATMDNELSQYLKARTTKVLTELAGPALAALTNAQRAVNKALQEVETFQSKIDAQEEPIRRERALVLQQLHAAEDKVNHLAGEITRVERQIVVKEEQIRQDRTAALKTAQDKVNRIQSVIDDHNRAIRQLKHEIAWLKQKMKDTKFDPTEVDDNIERGFQIAAKGTAITGHEIAIQSEQLAMQGATSILGAAQKTAESDATIKTDPRVSSLYIELGGYQTALPLARETLRGLQAAINQAPVEADPRVAPLYIEFYSARGLLQAALFALAEVKLGLGEMAHIGEWLAQNGPGALLTITHAEFAGQLSAVNGGRVTMQLDLTFMGRAYQDLALAFNFHDLEQTVAGLLDLLKRPIREQIKQTDVAPALESQIGELASQIQHRRAVIYSQAQAQLQAITQQIVALQSEIALAPMEKARIKQNTVLRWGSPDEYAVQMRIYDERLSALNEALRKQQATLTTAQTTLTTTLQRDPDLQALESRLTQTNALLAQAKQA